MRAIFPKKGKKEQNIWKFGQKCTKFENILKKGSLRHATVACMKQLEYAQKSKASNFRQPKLFASYKGESDYALPNKQLFLP